MEQLLERKIQEHDQKIEKVGNELAEQRAENKQLVASLKDLAKSISDLVTEDKLRRAEKERDDKERDEIKFDLKQMKEAHTEQSVQIKLMKKTTDGIDNIKGSVLRWLIILVLGNTVINQVLSKLFGE